MPSTSHSKYQWRRKDDEEMEDLEVHIVWVITERSEHLVEPECPFTRLRKKSTIGPSGIPEEDSIQLYKTRGKVCLSKLLVEGMLTQPMEKMTTLFSHPTKTQCSQKLRSS